MVYTQVLSFVHRCRCKCPEKLMEPSEITAQGTSKIRLEHSSPDPQICTQIPPTKIFKTLYLYLNNDLMKGPRGQISVYRFFSITSSWARKLSYKLIDLTNGNPCYCAHSYMAGNKNTSLHTFSYHFLTYSVMPDIGVLIFWEYIWQNVILGFSKDFFNVQLPRYFFGICVQNPEGWISGYLWTLRQHWELMSEEGTFRKMTSSALAADMYYCLWWKCFGQNNSQVT